MGLDGLQSLKCGCFSYINDTLHFRRPLLTPGAVWSTFYDGFNLLHNLDHHSLPLGWKSQDIFLYNSEFIRLNSLVSLYIIIIT